jgi:hypothetical protein
MALTKWRRVEESGGEMGGLRETSWKCSAYCIYRVRPIAKWLP